MMNKKRKYVGKQDYCKQLRRVYYWTIVLKRIKQSYNIIKLVLSNKSKFITEDLIAKYTNIYN
jgi:hypothetical protein